MASVKRGRADFVPLQSTNPGETYTVDTSFRGIFFDDPFYHAGVTSYDYGGHIVSQSGPQVNPKNNDADGGGVRYGGTKFTRDWDGGYTPVGPYDPNPFVPPQSNWTVTFSVPFDVEAVTFEPYASSSGLQNEGKDGKLNDNPANPPRQTVQHANVVELINISYAPIAVLHVEELAGTFGQSHGVVLERFPTKSARYVWTTPQQLKGVTWRLHLRDIDARPYKVFGSNGLAVDYRWHVRMTFYRQRRAIYDNDL